MAAVHSPFWDMCPGVSVGTVGVPLRHGGSKLSDVPSYRRGGVWSMVSARMCVCMHMRVWTLV